MGTTEKGINHTVFERYTDEARRALFLARREAQRRTDGLVTVEDLLSGMSTEGGTRADRVGALKDNAFYLRWLVELPPLPAAMEAHRDGHLDMDGNAKKALLFAQEEADRDGEFWIDSDHLLRGLMRFPNKAHFALLKIETNLRSTRLSAIKDRQLRPSQASPRAHDMPSMVRKYAVLWGAPVAGVAGYLHGLIQDVGGLLMPRFK